MYNWGDAGNLDQTFTFAGTSHVVALPGMAVNGIGSTFVGFSSDTAFSFVSITDLTHGLLIGEVLYTVDAAVDVPGAEVPEPAMLGLMGLGLAGIALQRRRQRPLPAW